MGKLDSLAGSRRQQILTPDEADKIDIGEKSKEVVQWNKIKKTGPYYDLLNGNDKQFVDKQIKKKRMRIGKSGQPVLTLLGKKYSKRLEKRTAARIRERHERGLK